MVRKIKNGIINSSLSIVLVGSGLSGSLPLLFSQRAAAATNYNVNFETDAGDWSDTTTGTGAVAASSGTHYGVASDGAFTKWGGYENSFPVGGYTTKVKVYLDMSQATGGGTDKRFDFSSAINQPDGSHRRDFVFSLGTNPSTTNHWAASVSNTVPGWPLNPGRSPADISQTGWYNLVSNFHDNGSGVLAVTMSVVRVSDGTTMGSWTLSDSSDIIGNTVGGHRYGWFVGAQPAANRIASVFIDDATLTPNAPSLSACSTTNTVNSTDLSSWDLSDTRTTGHNQITSSGLHVWTESNTSTDKAAGYHAASFKLADLGEGFGMDATATTGTTPPALQLTVDLDGNGTPEGNLVAEPAAYGANTLWLSSNWTDIDLSSAPTTVNGGGTGKGGTVNAWLAAFPNAKVVRVGYSLGSGIHGDYTISKLTAGCTDYTFNLPPDTSGFVFVASPKYVRANNAGDESARVLVSSQTTAARFFVDGSAIPINGSYVGPSTSTTGWWRLKTALAAGQHTITAQVQIGSNWYDVNGSGIAYSIDTPWAEYLVPGTNEFFRPNDRVVRVKADDEFSQFDHMVTTINGVAHTVNRTDCTDQGNYVLCDLQSLNLPEGTYTASTTTFTKQNPQHTTIVSQPFTIDNTRPTLSNLHVTNSGSVYGSSITVAANATDSNGVHDVTFYLTAPRADGICDGNGTRFASDVETSPLSGSTYGASLNTAGLNGSYCLNAYAGDTAANHSLPVATLKVIFDNTAPDVPTNLGWTDSNGHTVADGGSTNLSNGTASWQDSSSDVDHYVYKYWNDIAGNPYKVGNEYTATVSGTSLLGVFNQGEGVHHFCLEAIDAAGNASACSTPFTVTYDHTAPVVSIDSFGQTNNVVQPTVSVDGSTTPTGYSYSWTTDPHVTISNTSALNPTFTANQFGHYDFTITVTDAAGNHSNATFGFTYSSSANSLKSNGKNTGSPLHNITTTTTQGGTTNTQQLTNNGTGTSTPQVLGASTTKSDQPTVNFANAGTHKSKASNAFLGLGWWWLAVLAAFAFFWFLFAARRSESK